MGDPGGDIGLRNLPGFFVGEAEEELPGFVVGALGVGRGVGFEPEVESFGPFFGLGNLLRVRKIGADAGEAPRNPPRWDPTNAP